MMMMTTPTTLTHARHFAALTAHVDNNVTSMLTCRLTSLKKQSVVYKNSCKRLLHPGKYVAYKLWISAWRTKGQTRVCL
jgi:hypothetical protein